MGYRNRDKVRMMVCNICGEPFNPACLSEVFEHEHRGISTDKEYYGEEVELDIPPQTTSLED
jgi:hypothetical protein